MLDGLKAGNEALKKVHAALDIDEIEQILEETKEGVDKQNEIDTLLSGALTEEDEEAVEAELESMIDEQENVVNHLPDVPEEQLPEKLPPAREKKAKPERTAVEA